MNTREKIIEAQAAIIDNLVLCEEAISRLYAIYAASIPEMEEFWQDLSKKEEIHANVLRSLHKQLTNGNIFRDIGRFEKASTDSFLQRVNDAISFSRENPVTKKTAIETALGIESSVLDAHFYDIVRSDASEYRIIAERLSTDTHEHLTTVQNKLLEIQSKKPSPPYQ